MSTSIPPAPIQPAATGSKRKVFLIVGILALLLISAGIAYSWWSKREITPVVLNQQEQLTLNQKISTAQERSYEPGAKTIILTEKEVNALFHHNTQMGDKIRFELANNAVHARIRTELDADLPVVGGRTLKAKARFTITDDQNKPAFILDDLTVWGISLPNAWLGDLKGENLLSNISSGLTDNRLAEGIKEIEVNHGQITITLAE